MKTLKDLEALIERWNGTKAVPLSSKVYVDSTRYDGIDLPSVRVTADDWVEARGTLDYLCRYVQGRLDEAGI